MFLAELSSELRKLGSKISWPLRAEDFLDTCKNKLLVRVASMRNRFLYKNLLKIKQKRERERIDNYIDYLPPEVEITTNVNKNVSLDPLLQILSPASLQQAI